MPRPTRRPSSRRTPDLLTLAALLAAAALMAPPASAQDAPVREAPGAGGSAIPAEILDTAQTLRDQAVAPESRDQAYATLASLLTEVGPRFAGSPGDRAAVAWAVTTMERLGLENVRTEPVTVPRWIRRAERGETVSPFPQEMLLTALGGSVATPAEGLTAPVVRVTSLEDLESRPDGEVAGKIVFIDQAMERHRDGRGYSQTVPIRSRGPAVAGAKGAAAVLIRSVATGSSRFPHTGGTRYQDGVPQIPAAALAVPDADVLARQIEAAPEGTPVVFKLLLDTEMAGEAESANVIGEIRGSEHPEEIVLLGAHLDSWDITPGAHDDGSGCAIMLQAAHLIGRLPERPKRTVRVVLFANEEFGLSGAREYARAHAETLKDHVLATEADFGAGAVWRFAVSMAPEAVAEARGMMEVLAPLGIEWGGEGARGGADLIPLGPAGVPMVDLNPDGTDYFDLHHTMNDTLDQVDPEALAQNVAAYTAVAWWAANTETDLRPAPPRE